MRDALGLGKRKRRGDERHAARRDSEEYDDPEKGSRVTEFPYAVCEVKLNGSRSSGEDVSHSG